MPKVSHPRRGSMQYWPRARAKYLLARIRTWAKESKVKPLGFIGFKAGMTHVMAQDNHPKSMTKGEQIALPATMIECPPMTVIGVSYYKKTENGLRKVGSILAPTLAKSVSRLFPVPKVAGKGVDSVTDFDDLRIIVASGSDKVPSIQTKKPKVIEIALGGSKADKIGYAKEKLGKELTINDVFDRGVAVDIHGIGKGKGFQGTVKRFGVPIRQHKAEKTKRGIATLGSWTPKRVEFTVAQSGKMGFHLRTEYNKRILKIATGEEVNPTGGIIRYGVVRNPCVLLKGSVVGAQRRAVMLTSTIRQNKPILKDGYDVVKVIK